MSKRASAARASWVFVASTWLNGRGYDSKKNPHDSESFHNTIVVSLTKSRSQLDDAAAYADGDGLRAVAGAQFIHDVFDVNLNSLF